MTSADLERIHNGTSHICVGQCPEFENMLAQRWQSIDCHRPSTLCAKFIYNRTSDSIPPCEKTLVPYVEVIFSGGTSIKFPIDDSPLNHAVDISSDHAVDISSDHVVALCQMRGAMGNIVQKALYTLYTIPVTGEGECIRRFDTLDVEEQQRWKTNWADYFDSYQRFITVECLYAVENTLCHLAAFMHNEVHRFDQLSPIVAAILFSNRECWRCGRDGEMHSYGVFGVEEPLKNAGNRK